MYAVRQEFWEPSLCAGKTPDKFDLEKLVDTTDEWIRTRTGVETRHLAAASENTSDCV
ncbi:MAG: hypothetical protein ACLRP4_04230 [Dialister invisus]